MDRNKMIDIRRIVPMKDGVYYFHPGFKNIKDCHKWEYPVVVSNDFVDLQKSEFVKLKVEMSLDGRQYKFVFYKRYRGQIMRTIFNRAQAGYVIRDALSGHYEIHKGQLLEFGKVDDFLTGKIWKELVKDYE